MFRKKGSENMNEEIRTRLLFFHNLVSCIHNIGFYAFDAEQNCVFFSGNNRRLQELLFQINPDFLTHVMNMKKTGLPVVYQGILNCMWIADYEFSEDHELLYVHLIGPSFMDDVSLSDIDTMLDAFDVSLPFKRELKELMQQIPVIPVVRFFEYGIMLHYCITGEKITIAELQYPEHTEKEEKPAGRSYHDAYSTWAMEQKLLKLIEEGNLDFRKLAAKISNGLDPGNLGNGSSLRQIKNMMIISTALCTRAAIRGGLDADIAYSLSAKYIRGIEAGRFMSEIIEVNNTMQDDFVHRVHQIHEKTGISPQIRKCCDFIQIHTEDKINLHDIAEICGYSPEHLSRKFKKETGMTITQFITKNKIERSKELLRIQSKSIQEICLQLGFESQSYFGVQFKKETGMSPAAFRQKSFHKRKK